MLQYLINLSCIWLASLIVFDLFLKKESYHGYNRIYINTTILLGLFLPLWSWQQGSIIYASDVSGAMVTQASVLRDNLVSNTANTVVEFETWLLGIYALGVIIVFSILIKELFTIRKLYTSGIKSKSGVWTIIETNKNISPFSAFRFVFINKKENYTEQELQIILAHEQEHGHLLHFIDLLFTNIVKVLFWFNPLIYFLEKRLLMVHEYQADAAVDSEANTYGQFLIEQSMLNTAPMLAHSFIRKPLKLRIKMLTKKSSLLAISKKFITIPLLLITILCFTQNSFVFGQRKVDGNKITYNGNVFEKIVSDADTVMVQDPITGDIQMVLTTRDGPIIKMNGAEIIHQYYNARTLPLEMANIVNKIKAEVGNTIGSDIKNIKKQDGSTFQYNIYQIVIDRKGEIIYYELSATKYITDKKTRERFEIPQDVRENISKKIAKILDNFNATIIYENGVAKPYVLSISDEFIIN